MKSLKQCVRTLFFPTIWIANHLSMVKKFLLFLSLNLVVISYLSLAYFNELKNSIKKNHQKIQALELGQELFSLMISLQETRGTLNAQLRDKTQFNTDFDSLHEKNVLLTERINSLIAKPWINKESKRQWNALNQFVRGEKYFLQDQEADITFNAYSKKIKRVIYLINSLAFSSDTGLSKKEKNDYLSSPLIYDILPAYIETFAQLRGIGAGILTDKKISEDQRQSIRLLKDSLFHQERRLQDFSTDYNRLSEIKILFDRPQKSLNILDQSLADPAFGFSAQEYFKIATRSINEYSQIHGQLRTELLKNLNKLKSEQEEHLFFSYLSISFLVFSLFYLLSGILISARSFTDRFLDVTKAVAQGEFDTHLNIHANNEYGKIAQGLNKMVEELKENAQIIDKYIDTSITDLEGKILSVSSAFVRHSGYTKEELIGNDHNILRHKDTKKKVYEQMWKRLLAEQSWEGELKNRRKDGSDFWVEMLILPKYDENHRHKGFISIRRDITNQKHIEELSITDYLTQVYNRKYFNEKLKKTISLYRRYQTPFALLMFDIDYFKNINDTYGHLIGDEALVQLSSLVSSHLRENDILARWGGEEFMILLPHSHQDEAMKIAHKLRSLVEHHLFSEICKITVSFGVASFLKNDSFDTILERTDKALYQAKHDGRNRVVYL